MKKTIFSLLSAALVGTAAAQPITITPQSELGSVNIIRGVQVIEVSSKTTLNRSDTVLSSAEGAYEIALDNCTDTINGESTLDVSQITCEGGDFLRDENGSFRPIVIASAWGGAVLFIKEVASDDNDDESAPAQPVSP